MAAQRILIRDASNFQGLDGRFFRVAVRLKEKNDLLVEALQRSLTEKPDVPEPGYSISACGHH
jgi:threonine-phosphate decarboxylase